MPRKAKSKITKTWLMVITASATALIIGGGAYCLVQYFNLQDNTKRENINTVKSSYQQIVSKLEKQIATLENTPAAVPEPKTEFIMLDEKSIPKPKDWGEITKVEPYQEAASGETAPNTYKITYSQNVVAIYQKDVNKVYWSKLVESDQCPTINKKYNLNSPFDKCLSEKDIIDVYQDGIYNNQTKGTITFKRLSFRGRNAEGNKVLALNAEVFSVLTTDGKKQKLVFSPKKNYLAYNNSVFEGCGAGLVSSTTGKTIITGGCNPTITFSADENTVVSQSTWDLMGEEPGYFTFFNQNKTANVPLPCTAVDPTTTKINIEPIDDIIVTYLDNSILKYQIKNTAANCPAGDYEFIFASGKLNKIK
ncbi:MAG: hypothetical protein WC480_01130 [Patescibacteria group bacterium]